MNMNKVKVTVFSPMIGAWQMAIDALNAEGVLKNMEYNGIFNYSAFGKNSSHWEMQHPNEKVTYLPESLLPDYGDGTDNWKDISAYKKYITDNNITPSDIMLGIPVCAGLSMLNTSTRGAGCAANKWMYETIKWHIAQGNNTLCLENAPGLVGKEGVKVLRNVEEILRFNGVSSEYKIHCTKTTTLNHGLPQFRARAFLFIYKSSEFKVLKNIINKKVIFEDFIKAKGRPEALTPGTHDITMRNTDPILQFIKDKNLWDEVRGLVDKTKEYSLSSTSRWAIAKQKEDPNIFNDYPKIQKNIAKWVRKLEMGKGYWDATPCVTHGKVNAIISKNAHRIIHPEYNRFLTVRELMDLMGYPDEMKLQEPLEDNFNHVCQSVPVCTAMDHIRWAQGIALNDPKYIARTLDDSTVNILQQNNMNMNLENTLLCVRDNAETFSKYKEPIKNKLKSFIKK